MKTRKLIGLLMAVVLLVSLVPMTAFAAGTDEQCEQAEPDCCDPCPPEYCWVLTCEEDDSCTGFLSLDDQLIGNSWFRMQHITLPSEDDSIEIPIVAGNPKNGANLVGTITIANVGGNKYQVTFAFDHQTFPTDPQEGDTCKIIVAGETVRWNYTGSGKSFDKAPGQNLAGTLDGVTFETDETEIDFFAHFSITTYTYVYAKVETP
ncbi:MAG TPA: hypothetical protein GXX23_00295 [Firmicutes bacterium]|nr:hypothetical protein [Candidatus Fermentithermobacillaceae bacterium]